MIKNIVTQQGLGLSQPQQDVFSAHQTQPQGCSTTPHGLSEHLGIPSPLLAALILGTVATRRARSEPPSSSTSSGEPPKTPSPTIRATSTSDRAAEAKKRLLASQIAESASQTSAQPPTCLNTTRVSGDGPLEQRFEIVKELGRGSYGRVYKVKTRDRVPAFRAMKVLDPIARLNTTQYQDIKNRFEDELSTSRFTTAAVEAADLTGLIPECLEAGLFEGKPALVFEFVDGKNLQDLLDTGTGFPLEIALDITRQIAKTLKAIFEYRRPEDDRRVEIIHRDIKPANVMLTQQGKLKLLDFGAAKADFAERAAQTSNLVYGSYTFVGPEVATQESFDPATVYGPKYDIYALGISLALLLLSANEQQRLKSCPSKENQPSAARSLLERTTNIAWPDSNTRMSVLALITGMLEQNPKNRLGACEIIRLIDAILNLQYPKGVNLKSFSVQAIRQASLQEARDTTPNLAALAYEPSPAPATPQASKPSSTIGFIRQAKNLPPDPTTEQASWTVPASMVPAAPSLPDPSTTMGWIVRAKAKAKGYSNTAIHKLEAALQGGVLAEKPITETMETNPPPVETPFTLGATAFTARPQQSNFKIKPAAILVGATLLWGMTTLVGLAGIASLSYGGYWAASNLAKDTAVATETEVSDTPPSNESTAFSNKPPATPAEPPMIVSVDSAQNNVATTDTATESSTTSQDPSTKPVPVAHDSVVRPVESTPPATKDRPENNTPVSKTMPVATYSLALALGLKLNGIVIDNRPQKGSLDQITLSEGTHRVAITLNHNGRDYSGNQTMTITPDQTGKKGTIRISLNPTTSTVNISVM